MSVRVFLGALVTVGLLAFSACGPNPSTKLVIDITGGFAFVPSQDKKTLQVAYLNSVDTTDCKVPQIGTQLIIVRADIVQAQPPAPEDRIYDLQDWDVSFPGLRNGKVSGLRKNQMPSPRLPGTGGDWKKAEYVPAIKDHHQGSKIRTDWKKFVSGIMTLTGGRIEGSTPSDPLMQDAKFNFKIGGVSKDIAAVTDKMVYTADVPGEQIEVVLTHRNGQTQHLVLKAPAPTKPVRLTLRGLHDMPMTGAYTSSIELKDFCAFYTLLDGGDNIPDNQRLKLFYEGPAVQASTSGLPQGGVTNSDPNRPQPSPGFYCSGDWF